MGIWDKVFKNELRKFCGRQPLKNLLSPLQNTLSHIIFANKNETNLKHVAVANIQKCYDLQIWSLHCCYQFSDEVPQLHADSAINNFYFGGTTQNLVIGRKQKRYEISVIKMNF